MWFPLDCPTAFGGPETGDALPDLVIFDLLGTLIPERPRIASALSSALLAAELPVDAEELAELTSQPTRAAVTRLVARRLRLAPEVARPLVSAIVDDFHARVLDSLAARPGVAIAPGAATLLAEFAAEGIHVAVDSELEGPLAVALVRHAGWAGTGLIEAIVGSNEVIAPRPGPGQIEEACRRCGLRGDVRIAKVVGTATDAQAAISANCHSVLSLNPDLVVGSTPASDLGDVAERILHRTLH